MGNEGKTRCRGGGGLFWGASLFVLLWPTVGYPLTLWGISKLRPRPVRRTYGLEPPITVVVPTYREAPLIRRRLEDLKASEYDIGKLQVIIVDSGSDDGTADVAEKARDEGVLPDLLVIREDERLGKAHAINLAIEASKNDIMVVTDGPTLFDPCTLRELAASFADPAVGAVTGDFHIPEEATASQEEESLFWKLRNRLRRLEAEVDSTPFLSGEMCAFRKSVVRRLDEDSTADDMNVGLRAREAGYRSVVDPFANFNEPRSASFEELNRSKARRVVGGLQELWRFKGMMLRPSRGLYGMLILPSDLFYYLPLRPLAMAFIGWRALGWLQRHPRLGFGLLSAAGRLGLRSEGVRKATLVAAFNEWMFVKGFWDWARGDYSVAWAQERSTRLAAEEKAKEGAQR